jgi:hypothetical protein
VPAADACDQPGGKIKHPRDPALIASAKVTRTTLVVAQVTLVELQRPAEPAYVPSQGLPPGAATTGERATSPMSQVVSNSNTGHRTTPTAMIGHCVQIEILPMA